MPYPPTFWDIFGILCTFAFGIVILSVLLAGDRDH